MSNPSSGISERLEQHPEVVMRGLARAFAEAGSDHDEVTISFQSPEIENLLKDAFNNATINPDATVPDPTDNPAEQLNNLSETIQNDTETSLTEATPAGASEVGALLAPHLAHPAGPLTAPTELDENTPSPTESQITPPASVYSTMPGEGSGEDTTPSPGNQPPPDLGPVSDIPGTPDVDPTAPLPTPLSSGGATPKKQSKSRKSKKPSAPNTDPSQGDSAFPYEAEAPEQNAALPQFAEQELAQQLGSPDTSTSDTTTPPNTSSGQTGSGLPSVSVPAAAPQAETSASASAQSQPQDEQRASTRTKRQTKKSQQREDNRQASKPRQMINSLRNRTKLKQIDNDIKETEKKLRDVEFKYSTEYICLVGFKELTDFITALLSLTGVLAFIGVVVSAVCVASQWLILWYQTKTWRAEVFTSKRVGQTALTMIIELIPILNMLPVNIVNALSLVETSKRKQKKYQAKLDRLQKKRHKLVNSRA